MSFSFTEKKNQGAKLKNNRLNYLIAIIFLIMGSMIAKLYFIQIVNQDKYLELADKQHRVRNELKAERGLIYLRQNGTLRAIALNTRFASFYINPRALSEEDIKDLLEDLFEVFHRQEVEEEVDLLLEKKEKKDLEDELNYLNTLNISEEEKLERRQEVLRRHESLKFDKEWQEFREIKRKLEIEQRENDIIEEYFNKVNFREKFSRLLRRKVEKEDLLKFYFQVLKESFGIDALSDLSVKNGKVMLREEQDISGFINGLHYEWEDLRYYPDKDIFSSILGFSNLENQGNYGLEGFFDDELRGKDGLLLGDKGSYKGKKIVIDKEEYRAPENGRSLVLTIDYAIQVNICQRLKEAQKQHSFTGASIIVMEPSTGKIVSLCTWPNFDPNNYQEVKDLSVFDNQVVAHQYEPGSVFKPLTMAIAIDQGKISPETYYEDKGQLNIKGWPKPISNSDFKTKGAHGWVTMTYALENSLNTGAYFAASQVGPQIFSDYLKKFGFGEKTGIELSSESSGNINNLLVKKVKEIDFATASFGQGVAVTPLQMISAFSALANRGILMKPYIIDEILDENNNIVIKTKPQELRRVVSEESAAAVSAMLVNVIEKGHAKKSKIEGYYVGGKTGTAQIPSSQGGYLEDQYIHNFLGYAPISNPRFVVLVKFDNPKTATFAEGTVVPVFGEIVDFLLKYYQIPKER